MPKGGGKFLQGIAGEVGSWLLGIRLYGRECNLVDGCGPNEAELTEMALIENIQREDLNAIEIALTFRKWLWTRMFRWCPSK